MPRHAATVQALPIAAARYKLLTPLYLRPHFVRKPLPGLCDRRDVCTDGTEAKLGDADLLTAADILHDLLWGARERLALALSVRGALQETDVPIGTYDDLIWVPPYLCADSSERGELVRDLLGMQAKGQPSLSVAGDATQGWEAIAADPDGGMRLLYRFGLEVDTGYLVIRPLIVGSICGPEGDADLQVFISDASSGLVRRGM
jgi:hypothetical protein